MKYEKTAKHMRLTARVCAFFLAAVVLFLSLPRFADPVYAASTEEEYRQQLEIIKGQIDEANVQRQNAAASYEAAKKEYEDLDSEYSDVLGMKESLSTEINALQTEINNTNDLINRYNEILEKLRAQIEEKQAEVDAKYEAFKTNVRNSYEDSLVSYLEIILNAESFTDMLSRIDIVSSMMDYNVRVMEELTAAREALEKTQAEYTEMSADAQARIVQLQEKVPLLEEKKAENEKLLAEISEKMQKALENKNATEKELAKAQSVLDTYEKQQQEVEAGMQELIRQKRLQEEERRRREREEAERKRQEEEERRRREEEERKKREGDDDPEVTTAPEPIIVVPDDDPIDDGSFSWPLIGYYKVSSGFGMRTDPFSGRSAMHNGIDIPAPSGTPIHACGDGVVIIATSHFSYGNYVVIDHGGTITTLYAHCSSLAVGVGQNVTEGQVIGYVGMTGSATGYHLHLGVAVEDVFNNPLSFVSPK